MSMEPLQSRRVMNDFLGGEDFAFDFEEEDYNNN